MNRQISIRQDAVDTTVGWILANNKHLRNHSYQQIRDSLQNCIDRVVKHANLYWELNYSGIAGFTVFFTPEDENYGTIEILVDPCVSTTKEINYTYIVTGKQIGRAHV